MPFMETERTEQPGESTSPLNTNPRTTKQGDARIRIDKWLWHARFFKTRSLAAKVVQGGHCRINRSRVSKPGYCVRPGDVLTFAQGSAIRVIEIVGVAERRGPAPEAKLLYNDLDPPTTTPRKDREAVTVTAPTREPGSGRPTKKERRQLDAVTQPL